MANISNDYLSINIDEDNLDFNSGATGVITGRSFAITSTWPNSYYSYAIVNIDNTIYRYGNYGSISQPPQSSNLTNETIYTWGLINVKQSLSIIAKSINADTGMYKYTATNNDIIPHDVGLSICIDLKIGSDEAAPLRIPGIPYPITKESEFSSPNIPEKWQAFDKNNPSKIAYGTLIGYGATQPDKFILCKYDSFLPWNPTIDPLLELSDSVVLIIWNPITLNPGESKDFITFYGIDSITPITTHSIGPSQTSDGWFTGNLNITLNAIDSSGGSNIKEIHYKLGDSPEITIQDNTTNFDFDIEGITPLLYWAIDNNDNVEDINTVEIKFDKTAPLITIISPSTGYYLNSDTIPVNFTAIDENSGIKTILSTLDEVPVSTGDLISLLDKPGDHTFTVIASDLAGNTSEQSINFSVIVIAEVNFNPNMLNLNTIIDTPPIIPNSIGIDNTRNLPFANNYNFFKATIHLPSPYESKNIDISTVILIVNSVTIPAELIQPSYCCINCNSSCDESSNKLILFNRQAIINALNGITGTIDFIVLWRQYDNSMFVADVLVKVFTK